MSESILDKFESLLNEEKWTRATINNYSIQNFKDLDDMIKEVKDDNQKEELKSLIDEYLQHNKNSIIALYIYSVYNLQEGEMDHSQVNNLIKIFSDNLKWNIVEYLCNMVLDSVDDKFALKTLITAYNNSNKKEKLPELWERLIKIDFQEAPSALKLAEYKEEKGEEEDALVYYKKALHRYILNKDYSQVETLWKKLLEYENVGSEYFFNIEKKISKNFNNDRAIELLKYFYEKTNETENYDLCIIILKLILQKFSTDEYARKELVDMYRKKYKDHTYLDEYIKISDLDSPWRNVHEAIESFEKHIAFDKNNFVYHKTWGIGTIVDVSKDIFTINFQKKSQHKMSLKMALNSLQTIPKNHIWILKLKNKEKLREMVKKDIPWALKILIKSNNNRGLMKQFKAELVPDILSQSEWNTWWLKGRRILKTDSTFGTVENTNDIFQVRDKPLSFEEKIYLSFKSAKDFNQRFNFILDYIENAEPDPDYLEDMINYFLTFLNSTNNVTEQTILSYLLISNIKEKLPFLKINVEIPLKEFFEEIDDDDFKVIYQNSITAEYKKEYLNKVKQYKENWKDILLEILYLFPNKHIFEELTKADSSYLDKITKELLSRYKDYKEAFIWLVSNVLSEDVIEDLKINFDNIVFSLFDLIEITGKNINLKKDTTRNKKILKQVNNYLFKTDFILDYIDKSDRQFCERLYKVINDLISLEDDNKIKIKDKISEKYPDIDKESESLKYDISKASTSIVDKLLTCEASYMRVQNELLHIKDVEIPENSKDIGLAIEKGDLRENAEYKAAKERQSFLQNRITKITNDLSIAIIIKKENISTDFVTFGTSLELEDKINNKMVNFVILGPWESDSEKNIISYQSPLGLKLLDKKEGEEFEFKINDMNYHYIVKNISVADF